MPTRGYHDGGGRVSHYDPTLTTDHDSNLWHDCPLLEYQFDPSIGVLLDERFIEYDATNIWTLTQATTGAAAISTAAPGVLELDSNSTTQGQGANLQRLVTPFVPAAGKDIWFETKVKVVDTYDKVEFFAGLAATDTSIISGQDQTAANHIGWECHTNDGVLLFGAEKAGTEATPLASTTLAEATYVKLGFKVTGVTSVAHYVNGTAIGTTHLTANIPIVAIYPSFVCQSGGTNDPILHIAGYRVFQLR